MAEHPNETGLPANFSLSVTETKAWRLAAISSIGTGHIHKATHSEDAIYLTAYGDTAIAVIADGVSDSKAALSGEGARRAVRTCAAAIGRGLAHGLDRQDAITQAFAAVHVDLITLTGSGFWGLYACTLAAAIITDTSITIGHIGDSCIYASDGKRLSRVAAGPVHTSPITIVEPQWRDGFTTQNLTQPYIKAVVLATDGTADFFTQSGPAGVPQPRHDLVHDLTTYVAQNPEAISIASAFVKLMSAKGYTRTDDRSLVFAFRKE